MFNIMYGKGRQFMNIMYGKGRQFNILSFTLLQVVIAKLDADGHRDVAGK